LLKTRIHAAFDVASRIATQCNINCIVSIVES